MISTSTYYICQHCGKPKSADAFANHYCAQPVAVQPRPPTFEERLAALEARVESLEQRLASA